MRTAVFTVLRITLTGGYCCTEVLALLIVTLQSLASIAAPRGGMRGSRGTTGALTHALSDVLHECKTHVGSRERVLFFSRFAARYSVCFDVARTLLSDRQSHH